MKIEKFDFNKYNALTYNNVLFDKYGIDYTDTVKIPYVKTDKGFKNLYPTEQFIVICYIINNINNYKYFKTTMNTILDDINISFDKLKQILNQLINSKIITLHGKNKLKDIKGSGIIEIHYNEIYNQSTHVLFPRFLLEKLYKCLKPNEFSLYVFLTINQSYIIYNYIFNNKKNNINYLLSYRTLSDLVNLNQTTCFNTAKKLYGNNNILLNHKNIKTNIHQLITKLDYFYIFINQFFNIADMKNSYIEQLLTKYDKSLVDRNYEQYLIYQKAFEKYLVDEYLTKLNINSINKSKLLESDLEDYLIYHLDLIEDGMTFIDRQYSVENGKIDILAKDKNNTICIIELKIVPDCTDIIYQCVYYPTQFKEKTRMITIAPSYNKKISKSLQSLNYVEMFRYKTLKSNNDYKILLQKIK